MNTGTSYQGPSPAAWRALFVACTLLTVLTQTRVGWWLFGRSLGESAESADKCRSGKLLRTGQGTGYCTDSCGADKDCTPQTRCYQDQCVPTGGPFGDLCSAPWDCQSLRCVATLPVGGGMFEDALACSRDCSEREPCPSGYYCAPSLRGDAQCVINGRRLDLHQ